MYDPEEDHDLLYEIYDSIDLAEHPSSKSSYGPQLVCKQYWSEVSEVFISSCTFMFWNPYYFQNFVLSHQKVVSQVRKVKVGVILQAGGYESKNLDQAFSASAVGGLKSLEGVHICFYGCGGISEARWNSNIMNDAAWVRFKLPVMIRAFQQHRLKETMTEVTLWYYSPAYDKITEEPAFCAQVRRHLLEYHPR